MSFYGIRDAAVNFQCGDGRVMIGRGYKQSEFNASLFFNRVEQVKVLVHGDDFAAV